MMLAAATQGDNPFVARRVGRSLGGRGVGGGGQDEKSFDEANLFQGKGYIQFI